MLLGTAVSHDDIRSVFIHQSSEPDVLPRPARAPSVPRISRISRLSSWGSFLGKATCGHIGEARACEVSRRPGKRGSPSGHRAAARGSSGLGRQEQGPGQGPLRGEGQGLPAPCRAGKYDKNLEADDVT